MWVARLCQSVPIRVCREFSLLQWFDRCVVACLFYLLIYVLLKGNKAELECEGERGSLAKLETANLENEKNAKVTHKIQSALKL